MIIANNFTPAYINPLVLAKEYWPGVAFYKEQKEIIYSVVENRETVVVAANKMGKDYTAGFIVLWFFLTRRPCRIVTTSAKDDHLRVLWGEIGRFISNSNVPLIYDSKRLVVDPITNKQVPGTGLIVNQREIGLVYRGQVDRESYVKGMVASADTLAAMQGHHATPSSEQVNEMRSHLKTNYTDWERLFNDWMAMPRSMFVSDESSSVPDDYYKMADTWAERMLIFGNSWPCANFFKRAVKGNPKTKDRGGDLAWA